MKYVVAPTNLDSMNEAPEELGFHVVGCCCSGFCCSGISVTQE